MTSLLDVKYRFTLAGDQVVELFARTDGEACRALEELKPGTSGHVVRVDRDVWWFGPLSQKASA